jgi:hypothetical protein
VIHVPEISDKFVVVTVTHDEARVWATGTDPGSTPDKIVPPSRSNVHHHVRRGQHHHMHRIHETEPEFLESISAAIADAGTILLIGHGKGKADSLVAIVQHLERKHPTTAHKVIGAIHADLPAMTEGEILKLAREWFAAHPR